MLIHCLFLAHRCVKRWLYSASSSDLKLHYRGWGGVQKEVHALIKQQHWHHLGNPRILLSKHVTQVDGAKKRGIWSFDQFDHREHSWHINCNALHRTRKIKTISPDLTCFFPLESHFIFTCYFSFPLLKQECKARDTPVVIKTYSWKTLSNTF